MVLVVLGRIDHGAGFDTDLLEQIPHFLVDVLLRWKKKKSYDRYALKLGLAETEGRDINAYIPGDDHAAKLVYDEDIKLGGRLTELLLEDLKDGLHYSGGVP